MAEKAGSVVELGSLVPPCPEADPALAEREVFSLPAQSVFGSFWELGNN